MAQEHIYVGTELKYLVDVSAEGLSFDEIKMAFDIVCGKVTIHKEKSDLIIDDQDQVYLTIDTAMFPKGGDLYVIATISVPDADYPDGYRTEVHKDKLLTINKL